MLFRANPEAFQYKTCCNLPSCQCVYNSMKMLLEILKNFLRDPNARIGGWYASVISTITTGVVAADYGVALLPKLLLMGGSCLGFGIFGCVVCHTLPCVCKKCGDKLEKCTPKKLEEGTEEEKKPLITPVQAQKMVK